MAEETKAAEPQEQQAEQTEQATDWQAKYEAMRQHAREWEKAAKANKGAADELEKLKAEQMTEQEKALARAEKAEKQLAELQAEQQRAEAVAEVSKATGVPTELLAFCADRDTMERFAQAYAQTLPETHAAGRTAGSALVNEGTKPSNADTFARLVKEQFNF